MVIVFNRLWDTMQQKGVSTYFLREKCGIDSKTVRRLRANENIETKTLNKLCAARDCRLEDLAREINLLGMEITPLIISRIEKNQRHVCDAELKMLAKALGVTMDWLCAGDEEA